MFAFWLLQLTASIWERGKKDKNYKVIEAQKIKDVRSKIRDRDKNSAEGVVTQFVNWLRLRFHCRGHGFYSWSGKILHAMWCGQKKKKINKLVGSLKKKKKTYIKATVSVP